MRNRVKRNENPLAKNPFLSFSYVFFFFSINPWYTSDVVILDIATVSIRDPLLRYANRGENLHGVLKDSRRTFSASLLYG